jgi:hypothetical protein
MSLSSVSDMNEHNIGRSLLDANPADNLANRFNTSLRLGQGRSSSRPPLRRQSSADGDLGQVMNMSVATLGDRDMSEYSNTSAGMGNLSDAQMSFSNVFEETEHEILGIR